MEILHKALPIEKRSNAKSSEESSVADQISTRNMIIKKSLELINQSGMVSFRIDSLASALKLSPGNITYHFSRKEDICVTLWDMYLDEYNSVQRRLTNLLDLKQVYLMIRTNMYLNYKYRGVLIFRSSDRSAMIRDKESGRNNENTHNMITEAVLQILIHKGYINYQDKYFDKIKDMAKLNNYIAMRWGLNFAYQNYPIDKIDESIDKIALTCLYSLYPIFTSKAREEFKEIEEIVSNNNLI